MREALPLRAVVVDRATLPDALAVTAAGLCTRIRTITCQEIFDYSTYNQPFAVKVSCGFGGSMDETPMMLLPTIPTMVWGGNIRLIGRGLGIEIDDITEEVERVALERTVETVLGSFEKGTQGAFYLKVIGWSAGRRRVVIEHITRIHPSCAPDWPQPDDAAAGGAGDHRVIVDGDPQLTIVVRADVPGGTRADGGNTTAANRLLGALPWLAEQKPGIYDGLDVPLHPPLPPQLESPASLPQRRRSAPPTAQPPPPGSRVAVRFKDGIEYAGTVEKVEDANHAFVRYDDGQSETVRFPDPDVRVTGFGPEAPAAKPAAKPRAKPPRAARRLTAWAVGASASARATSSARSACCTRPIGSRSRKLSRRAASSSSPVRSTRTPSSSAGATPPLSHRRRASSRARAHWACAARRRSART